MSFNYRKLLFSVKDKFSSNSIMEEYKEIKNILEGNRNNDKALNEVLVHAKQNCTYYKDINVKEFESIPIVTRTDIIEHEEQMIAKNYVGKPYRIMQTSGSSGTPLKIKQDVRKKSRSLADVIYFNEQAGQAIGERYIFLRGWIDNYKKSKLEQYATNLIPIDVTTLNEEKLNSLYHLLKKDKRINCLLGYASTFDKISDYLNKRKKEKDVFHIRSIISSSEVLTQHTVRKLNQIFSCRVVSRYANQECGVLGQADMSDGTFKMNTASYKIEVLNLENNDAVSEGEIGRIVVTDLYNYYTPLIRYDTGDLGILLDREKGIIKEIVGRQGDIIYNLSNEVVSLSGFSNHMEIYPEIQQYQLIQKSKTKYLLKLKLSDQETLSEIKKRVLEILGKDADLEIDIVDNFPLLPSGKFKTMINETETENSKE